VKRKGRNNPGGLRWGDKNRATFATGQWTKTHPCREGKGCEGPPERKSGQEGEKPQPTAREKTGFGLTGRKKRPGDE